MFILPAPSRTPAVIHSHQLKIGWQRPDDADADDGAGDDEFGLVPWHHEQYPYGMELCFLANKNLVVFVFVED